ncbi:alpha-amylase family glycosyl hydrolase [Shigella flexneri]
MDDFDGWLPSASRGIRIMWIWSLTTPPRSVHVCASRWIKQVRTARSVWREGAPDSLPNNWRSEFGGNAGLWHAESEQYYLHLFAPEQAESRLGKPAGARPAEEVCEFWANRGVDSYSGRHQPHL